MLGKTLSYLPLNSTTEILYTSTYHSQESTSYQIQIQDNTNVYQFQSEFECKNLALIQA